MYNCKDFIPSSIAIALGANISSKAGRPQSTLIAARPIIEDEICIWIQTFLPKELSITSIRSKVNWNWSPLFETEARGGPTNQPSFINAVLLMNWGKCEAINPSEVAALDLLKRLFEVEKKFGRERKSSDIHWGPRSIDLDFLAWGGLNINSNELRLPHPRLLERDFVIIPLAAAFKDKDHAPRKIPAQSGWLEE